ncbi:SIMPL domain-containing protein [Haloplanus natans]|uniref:SIMPL domain-containing protein n=1 Tax=Haloplanus natans TaxID=376171 RepID=UPI000677AD13|nr:SIMPL domain-containing protein [Haloplanus natans]
MSHHVTTDGTGRREAMPDLAVVEVTVNGDGDSATAARETARDRTATVEESLSVSNGRIRTVERSINDTSELFEPETDAPYRATERLVVDCVPETVGDVFVEATDAGGKVGSIDFHLHEAVRRELRDEALEAATKRARETAERIAAVEGLVVGDVCETTARAACRSRGSGWERHEHSHRRVSTARCSLR